MTITIEVASSSAGWAAVNAYPRVSDQVKRVRLSGRREAARAHSATHEHGRRRRSLGELCRARGRGPPGASARRARPPAGRPPRPAPRSRAGPGCPSTGSATIPGRALRDQRRVGEQPTGIAPLLRRSAAPISCSGTSTARADPSTERQRRPVVTGAAEGHHHRASRERTRPPPRAAPRRRAPARGPRRRRPRAARDRHPAAADRRSPGRRAARCPRRGSATRRRPCERRGPRREAGHG